MLGIGPHVFGLIAYSSARYLELTWLLKYHISLVLILLMKKTHTLIDLELHKVDLDWFPKVLWTVVLAPVIGQCSDLLPATLDWQCSHQSEDLKLRICRVSGIHRQHEVQSHSVRKTALFLVNIEISHVHFQSFVPCSRVFTGSSLALLKAASRCDR